MSVQHESVGSLLANVTRLMRRTFERRLEGGALTHAQARTLVQISRREGIRQVALSELMEIQPITLVHVIDQLVEEKLVERRPDPADRRAYQLYLMPEAAPRVAAIEAVIDEIRRDALCGLSEAQVDAVIAALQTMHRNLSHSPIQTAPASGSHRS